MFIALEVCRDAGGDRLQDPSCPASVRGSMGALSSIPYSRPTTPTPCAHCCSSSSLIQRTGHFRQDPFDAVTHFSALSQSGHQVRPHTHREAGQQCGTGTYRYPCMQTVHNVGYRVEGQRDIAISALRSPRARRTRSHPHSTPRACLGQLGKRVASFINVWMTRDCWVPQTVFLEGCHESPQPRTAPHRTAAERDWRSLRLRLIISQCGLQPSIVGANASPSSNSFGAR